MKTKLYLIIAVGMISNAVFGQISLRPYAGINISKFTYGETSDLTNKELQVEKDATKFKPGLNAGLGINFPLNDIFSIETGIGLIQKGAKYTQQLEELGFKYRNTVNIQISYLTLPLMLNMEKEIGDVKFSIFGGPSVNFRVKYKQKYKIEYDEDLANFVEEGESTNAGELKYLDLNFNMGGRIEYENFNLGLTYLHGLTDISQGGNVKNTSFLINLGYRFEL
jgi:hypothetical protein